MLFLKVKTICRLSDLEQNNSLSSNYINFLRTLNLSGTSTVTNKNSINFEKYDQGDTGNFFYWPDKCIQILKFFTLNRFIQKYKEQWTGSPI